MTFWDASKTSFSKCELTKLVGLCKTFSKTFNWGGSNWEQLFRFYWQWSNHLWMAKQNNMLSINEDQIFHCWFFMAFYLIILFKELMWQIDCRFLLKVFLSSHLMIDRFLFLWEISPKWFFFHIAYVFCVNMWWWSISLSYIFFFPQKVIF